MINFFKTKIGKLLCRFNRHNFTLFSKRQIAGFRKFLIIKECGRCGFSTGDFK